LLLERSLDWTRSWGTELGSGDGVAARLVATAPAWFLQGGSTFDYLGSVAAVGSALESDIGWQAARGLWFGGRASAAAAHGEGGGCEVAVGATYGSAGGSRLRLACGCGWHGCG